MSFECQHMQNASCNCAKIQQSHLLNTWVYIPSKDLPINGKKYLQQVSDITTSFHYSVLAASAVKSIMNSKIKFAKKISK